MLSSLSEAAAHAAEMDRFYDERISRMDAEQELLYEKIDGCRPSADEQYWLRCTDQALGEIEEGVDEQLGALRAKVEARKVEFAEGAAQLKELAEASQQNRVRIQRLLALSRPVSEHDMTFIFETKGAPDRALPPAAPPTLEDVVKSIRALPPSREAVSSLKRTVDTLAELRGRYEGVTRSAVADLCRERGEHAARQERIQEATGKLKEALSKRRGAIERKLRAATKEYLLLRHNAKVFSGTARAERGETRRMVEETSSRIAAMREKAAQDVDAIRRVGEMRIEEATESAKEALFREDCALSAAREESEAFHGERQAAVDALTADIRAARRELRRSERKRARDLNFMRQQLSDIRATLSALRGEAARALRLALHPSAGLAPPPVRFAPTSETRDRLAEAAYLGPDRRPARAAAPRARAARGGRLSGGGPARGGGRVAARAGAGGRRGAGARAEAGAAEDGRRRRGRPARRAPAHRIDPPGRDGAAGRDGDARGGGGRGAGGRGGELGAAGRGGELGAPRGGGGIGGRPLRRVHVRGAAGGRAARPGRGGRGGQRGGERARRAVGGARRGGALSLCREEELGEREGKSPS